jgi:transcriptional regulator GlxA family with amidase domain
MDSAQHRVTGWINVTSYNPKPYDESGGVTLSDVHVTQDFTGGLIGIGVARFLMVQLADGSAVFTGIERFTGTLADRTGSFILRNSGLLKDNQVTSEWLVIPGSGTGELTGLRAIGGAGPNGYFLDFWFE